MIETTAEKMEGLLDAGGADLHARYPYDLFAPETPKRPWDGLTTTHQTPRQATGFVALKDAKKASSPSSRYQYIDDVRST